MKKIKPGVMMHTYNLMQEAEVGRSWQEAGPRAKYETLSEK
jgi:hypothetical protein